MSAAPLASHVDGSPRTPLRIDVLKGRIETAGQKAKFDPAAPDAALIAYLRLVRRLRDVEREPSFVLRRDDVVTLAGALRQDAVVVLDRLGELMGATVTQRRSMVTSFLAGALLIAVATGATALAPGDGRGPVTRATSGDRSDVVAGAPFEQERGQRHGAASSSAGPSTTDSTRPAVGVAAPRTGAAAVATSATSSVASGAANGAGNGAGTGGGAGRSGVVDGPSGRDADVARGRAPRTDEAAPTAPPRGPRREIVQPGATIDIPDDPTNHPDPPDETDPPGETDPPVDVDPPVGPPVDVDPPVGPPVDVDPPVGPPVDVDPPVGPPSGEGSVDEDADGDGGRGGGHGHGGGQGNGEGNRGVGQGNGGGNGTGNEGNGKGPAG